MMKKRLYQIRKEVLSIAHQLTKAGMSFGEAQKKAWENYRLKSKMHTCPMFFYFKKKDGSERLAFGSLESRYMQNVKGTGKSSTTVTNYFDLEKQEWRSFQIQNLIGISSPGF